MGDGGKGNEGVAGILTNTPGSIGYINQAYVKGKLRSAALQNRAGAFVKPGLKSGTDALSNIREAISLWLEVEAEEAGVKSVETLELAV